MLQQACGDWKKEGQSPLSGCTSKVTYRPQLP